MQPISGFLMMCTPAPPSSRRSRISLQLKASSNHDADDFSSMDKKGSDDEEKNNDKEAEEEEEQERITNEQIYREIMGIPPETENKKKSKNTNNKQQSIKRPHDNRDKLPFLVQVMTPGEEPYQQQALQQQQTLQKNSKKKSKKGMSSGSVETEAVGETLGEFAFEKNTSSGDKIEIDNQVYVVQKAKCQYRYAGGQKFEMVRKILQVKPVQRAMQEDYILRQWNAPPAKGFE
jgi:hypothetical protein